MTRPCHTNHVLPASSSHIVTGDSKDVRQRRRKLMKERAPLLNACDHVRDTLTQNGIQIKVIYINLCHPFL